MIKPVKEKKPKSVKVVTLFCPVCVQKVPRGEFVAHASAHLSVLEGGSRQPSVDDGHLSNQEGYHGEAI